MKEKELLKESITNTKFEVIENKPSNVLKRIKMKLSDWLPNRNGRVYSRELWENVVNSDYVKETINTHTLFGELDHPEERLEISLQNVSHAINNMWLEEDGVYGELDILPTPQGQVVNQLIEYGSEIGISSRGTGSVNGNVVDADDYTFVTFDIVARPSVAAARLQAILESVEIKNKDMNDNDIETILESYKKDLKEEEISDKKQLFIDYCKDKIRDSIKVDAKYFNQGEEKEEIIELKIGIKYNDIYLVDFYDALEKLDTEEPVYYNFDTKELIFTNGMDTWEVKAAKLDFKEISRTLYQYILDNWEDHNFEDLILLNANEREQREKVEEELKLPEPFKYYATEKLGGLNVEIYCNDDLLENRPSANTIIRDSHPQEYFDIDGLWEVVTYDKDGNFKEEECIGWEKVVEILKNNYEELKGETLKEGELYKLEEEEIEIGELEPLENFGMMEYNNLLEVVNILKSNPVLPIDETGIQFYFDSTSGGGEIYIVNEYGDICTNYGNEIVKLELSNEELREEYINRVVNKVLKEDADTYVSNKELNDNCVYKITLQMERLVI